MRHGTSFLATRRVMTLRVAALMALVLGISILATAPSRAAGTGGGGTPAEPAAAAVQPDRFATVDRREARPGAADVDRLRAVAARRGEVRAVVGLKTTFTPAGALTAAQATAQRAATDRARGALLGALSGTDFSVVHTYEFVPYVALRLSPGALEALVRSGRAASVQEDTADRAVLAQSRPLVEATEATTLARSGTGQHIAILDTGVDKFHSFLQQTATGPSKVVSEACFSANASCPNGLTTDLSVGSGLPCTYAPSACRHGTHVAGIAAGRGTAFSGVARSARLLSIQVFSRFTGANCVGAGEDPCALSFTSDQMAGLDRVFALRSTFRIASVNMSIGGGLFTANCDADARKASIDNLRSAGIATVIASGNNGNNTAVSAPACISTAVTVGSTTKTDLVSSFSNSSPLVELLAPGEAINSSVPGGGFAVFNGTSMATPHVAGAWAIMRQVNTAASVPTVLAALQTTGKPVTDPDNGVTVPRIRVLSASVRLRDTGFKSGGSFSFVGGGMASNGAGLATRAGGPAASTIAISGIPAGATIRNAFLYWMTIGGPDASAVFQGVSRAGTLVGASQDTCWGVNQLGPNRVYRATLPVSAVPGNGTYSVSGVGGVGGADGQGASLVVVFSQASSARTGKVFLRHGAMTVNDANEAMTHTFTGLSVPNAPVSAALHMGVADGQAAFDEGPVLFAGTAVTGANFYPGADGAMWDDDRIPLATSLLPVGTTSRTNSVRTVNDCLAWSYAGLTYQH